MSLSFTSMTPFRLTHHGNVHRKSISRRYTFPLRAGHKTAYLCTETTMYRYVDNLDAPKKWFKANVDAILDVFGAQHHVQKEDLYFGKLDSLTVSVIGHTLSSHRHTGHPRACVVRES